MRGESYGQRHLPSTDCAFLSSRGESPCSGDDVSCLLLSVVKTYGQNLALNVSTRHNNIELFDIAKLEIYWYPTKMLDLALYRHSRKKYAWKVWLQQGFLELFWNSIYQGLWGFEEFICRNENKITFWLGILFRRRRDMKLNHNFYSNNRSLFKQRLYTKFKWFADD